MGFWTTRLRNLTTLRKSIDLYTLKCLFPLGVVVLPPGKRRDSLASSAEQLIYLDFSVRCLVFGGAEAEQYALVRAQRKLAGRPISAEDAQIAAIAIANQLTLVTRNTKDFEGLAGLQVTNP